MPPSAKPTPAATVPPCSIFRRHLKRIGLKYTTERADTLDAVTRFDGPFDVETLLLGLTDRGHRVSKATVYRTLKLLVDSGILSERPDARDCVRYELIHGRPAANIEVRRPDGSRIALYDERLAQLAQEVCRASGLTADRHVLIVEAGGAPNDD